MVFRHKGFTLVELMVTLAVAATVLALALPSFQRLMQSNRADAIGSEFATALTLARMEALKQARRVTICASSDGATCVGNWEDGYIVIVDSAATDIAAPVPVPAPALGVIRKWGALSNGASLTAKFDALVDTNYIRFTSLGGFARPAGGQTSVQVDIILAGCSGINVPRITVGLTGMVSSIDRACP